MKAVGIAELKAKLSEHLRRVRRGEHLIVEDRGTPVAEIRPLDRGDEPLPIRQAVRSLRDVVFPHAGKGEPYTQGDMDADRRGDRS